MCRSSMILFFVLSSLCLMGCVKKEAHQAAMVNIELGLGYLEMEQIARAKTKLTHAVQMAPNLPEAHTAYAYFLEKVGDTEEAALEHKKAIQLVSGTGSVVKNNVKRGVVKNKGAVFNNYGAFLCRRAQYKEAESAFKMALEDKDYPKTAEVYENAGLCALKAKEFKQAEYYLKTAILRDPNLIQAKNSLESLNSLNSLKTDHTTGHS